MKQWLQIILLLLSGISAYSQYSFEGQIAENSDAKTVYLSIIEDYRKLSRPYWEQIIKKTTVDSLGFFKFHGDDLSASNRIYRIHIDACSDGVLDANHFFEQCANSSSILFIASNTDTIQFPTSLADEVLCEISTSNTKSSLFLEINALKEEMAFDFYDVKNEASRKLNSKKWFTKWHSYGTALNEPLAELYIFDFLSDKSNETYAYYLKDVVNSSYYTELAQRLEKKYPNAPFTNLFKKEITVDKQMMGQHNSSNSTLKWILAALLTLSVLLNIYLFTRQKIQRKEHHNAALNTLTAQERKIVNEILKDKTNKEIATDLFISVSTVKTHINNLYKKLHIASREDIKRLFR